MNTLAILALLLEEPAETAPSGGFTNLLIPMLLVFGIFWIVMIGPERKRKKKHEELLGGLKKGDKVMTTAGIYGSVVQVKDDTVHLQVADGVRMKFARHAVQGIIDGTEDEKS